MTDMIRIDGKITIDVSTLVSQADYEAWSTPGGDTAAAERVANKLGEAAYETLHDAQPADLEVTEAWLVDENEDEIVRLKKF